jgi:hypothetical protein
MDNLYRLDGKQDEIDGAGISTTVSCSDHNSVTKAAQTIQNTGIT